MTRNQRDALLISAGLVAFWALAIYALVRSLA